MCSFFFFSSRRRHTRLQGDWSSDVCSSDLFEMLASHARQDLSGYYRLNALIHSAINRAAANPVLAETYGRINARVQSLRFRTNQDAAKWKRAVQEHERMLEALQEIGRAHV